MIDYKEKVTLLEFLSIILIFVGVFFLYYSPILGIICFIIGLVSLIFLYKKSRRRIINIRRRQRQRRYRYR